MVINQHISLLKITFEIYRGIKKGGNMKKAQVSNNFLKINCKPPDNFVNVAILSIIHFLAIKYRPRYSLSNLLISSDVLVYCKLSRSAMFAFFVLFELLSSTLLSPMTCIVDNIKVLKKLESLFFILVDIEITSCNPRNKLPMVMRYYLVMV